MTTIWNPQATKLTHGEYFRGIASALMSAATLKEMRNAFQSHNNMLEKQMEEALIRL